MTRRPSLSIILPCYNPQPDWAQRIAAACRDLEQRIGPFELIVVDDGTTATNLEPGLAWLQEQRIALQAIRSPVNRGKGHAVRQGLAHATGDWLVYTDVDFPYTPESLEQILHALDRPDCDVAVGIKDAAYYTDVPPLRRVVSRLLRRLSATLLRLSISDTQCGLKGLKRTALPCFLAGSIDRYLFDLESLYRAERAGLKLVPVPVTLRPGVVFSSVRLRLLAGELRNFFRILRHR